jgi:hypothetical protein
MIENFKATVQNHPIPWVIVGLWLTKYLWEVLESETIAIGAVFWRI